MEKIKSAFWLLASAFIVLVAILFLFYFPASLIFDITMFFLPLVFIAVAAYAVYQRVQTSDALELGGQKIILNVPANHVWVLRNTLDSSPGRPLLGIYPGERLTRKKGESESERQTREKEEREPKGYEAKKEGWSYRIPILQEELGIVSLKPMEDNIQELKVNTRDSQTVVIDMQMTTRIKYAVRFLISIEGNTIAEKMKNREKLELDLLSTATNRACSNFVSEELQKKRWKVYQGDEDSYWLALKNIYETKIDSEERLVNPEHDEYVAIPRSTAKEAKFSYKPSPLIKNDPDEPLRIYKDYPEKSELWKLITFRFKLEKEKLDQGTNNANPTPKSQKTEKGKSDQRERNSNLPPQSQEEKSFTTIPIRVNQLIRNEMKRLFIPELYGIEVVQIGVQRIDLPPEVTSALNRERAATIERRAASDESEAMAKMIERTRANPTAVTLGQLLADVLRDVMSKKKG